MSCKQNLKLFLFNRGLLVDFIGADWVEAKSVLSGNFYPFVTVTDQISFSNYECQHCICPFSSFAFNMHSRSTNYSNTLKTLLSLSLYLGLRVSSTSKILNDSNCFSSHRYVHCRCVAVFKAFLRRSHYFNHKLL